MRKTNWEAVKALLPPKEPNIYDVRRVQIRCDVIDTFNNGVDRRLKELFYLFSAVGISLSTSSAQEGMTHPGKRNFPDVMPQRASLSLTEPNFTKWGLELFKKILFSPESKLSVNAARSCSLSNLEPLNLAKGEKGEEIGGGKDWELALCIRSGPSSYKVCTLVET